MLHEIPACWNKYISRTFSYGSVQMTTEDPKTQSCFLPLCLRVQVSAAAAPECHFCYKSNNASAEEAEENKLNVTAKANHMAHNSPEWSTPSQASAKNPTINHLNLLKTWRTSSPSPRDHHGCRQHSQSALISSHTAAKLCGYCGLALQCVFASCGHHEVWFKTTTATRNPAILYSNRMIAKTANSPLQGSVIHGLMGMLRVCASSQRGDMSLSRWLVLVYPPWQAWWRCLSGLAAVFTQQHLSPIPFVTFTVIGYHCSDQKCHSKLS